MVYTIETNSLFKIFEKVDLIRSTEEKIAEEYSKGEIRCPTHLSIGQEFVPSILSLFLNNKDFCVSTHRGHAHYLAKGGSLKKFIAEIYGKETGCCKGKGGSMHLIDKSVGFMGTSAIVGNSIPTGVGMGLHIKLNNLNAISVVYFGEGATEEGSFYESINFAAVQSLPVLFICENNLYSVYSPLKVRQPEGRKIHQIVKTMGIKSISCDGNDIFKTYKLLKKTSQNMKKNPSPFFIEFSNYRWREHCGPNYDNELGYRTKKEYLYWKKKDPLSLLESFLKNKTNHKGLSLHKLKKFNSNKIKSAFKFAKSSKFPTHSKAFSSPYK